MTDDPKEFGLVEAISCATDAHEGQVDKAGKPYITHPLRVMRKVDGDHAKMAAVLHDVIEDTKITGQDLLDAGCPPEVVETVLLLTKRDGESQEDYLSRVATEKIAIAVKRADLDDNQSPIRFDQLDPATQDRLRVKYTKARELLDEYEKANGFTKPTPKPIPRPPRRA